MNKYVTMHIYNLFVSDYSFAGLTFIISLLIRTEVYLHQVEDNLIDRFLFII